MEYTENEKRILSLIKFTDPRKISLGKYLSRLTKLRPEVIENLKIEDPELMQKINNDLQGLFTEVMKNNEVSLNNLYMVYRNEQTGLDESSISLYDLGKRIIASADKCLDGEDISSQEKMQILNFMNHVYCEKIQYDKDICSQKRKISEDASQKDSENKLFGYGIAALFGACVTLVIDNLINKK